MSNTLIDDVKLLQLKFHSLALEYLEEGTTCFIELNIEDKSKEKIEDNQEPQLSDLEEEKK